MTKHITSHCPDLPGHSLSEPHRVIAVGFYDGPTRGILQCGVCAAEYLFDMIDCNETDDGEDTRIFSLAPLPLGSFEEVVAVCPKEKGPFWPVWAPRWVFASKQQQESASRRVEEILGEASQPEMLMGWIGYWGRKILAAKKLSTEDLSDVQDQQKRFGKGCDWFAFLGLSR